MNFLALSRYLVFATFIVLNAILASVAVWNFSLVSMSSRVARIDIYIVVVAALGLALTFTIIFTELVRKNAFTARIWFEVAWTSVFCLLDLSAAVVVTAISPVDTCGSTDNLIPANCTSTRVLQGFTWACSVVLLLYLTLLVALTVANRDNEDVPRIWECAIHNFPPLSSLSTSIHSFTPRLRQEKPAVVVDPFPPPPTRRSAAPRPRRGLISSEYEIEHFQPPVDRVAVPEPISPVASPADHLHRDPSRPGTIQAAVALYPQYLSSAYTPPIPTSSGNRSPPPLGDWPRPDAPLRLKRKAVPQIGPGDHSLSPQRPVGPRVRSRRDDP